MTPKGSTFDPRNSYRESIAAALELAEHGPRPDHARELARQAWSILNDIDLWPARERKAALAALDHGVPKEALSAHVSEARILSMAGAMEAGGELVRLAARVARDENTKHQVGHMRNPYDRLVERGA